MKVIGVIYEGKGKYGDFDWMIKQKKYRRCLFIFNDNEEKHFTCEKGKGNAIIRQYNMYSDYEKRNKDYGVSAGIPTGTLKRGGYKILTERVKNIIDDAFIEVDEWIDSGRIDKIFYSCEEDGYTLGTSLFKVGDKVIEYITEKIDKLRDYN